MNRSLALMLPLLLASGSNLPARAAEATLSQLHGHYINYMGFEPASSMELYLAKDGSATYTLSTREPGTSPLTKKSESFRGRWSVNADLLTVSVSDNAAESTVEYKVTSCLSYVSNTSVYCSHGIEPAGAATVPPFSQQLWYVVKAGRP